MARSIGIGRSVEIGAARPAKLPKDPALAPQGLEFFSPLRGLDLSTRLSHLDRGHAAVMKNYVIDHGRAVPRLPVAQMGTEAPATVMFAADLVAATGDRIPFRMTTLTFDLWDEIAQQWNSVPGVNFTGGELDFFAVTAFGPTKTNFGSRLLFSNGVDGLWEYEPSVGTVTRITTSAKVPSARHLTTFNGRVIATNVTDDSGTHQTRTRWSVKDNETLWDDADPSNPGAGYEDSSASPDLESDIARATVPLTETVAMLVRTRSVWLMQATGFVDAPFQFSLLFGDIGSESTYSIDTIPGGIVGWFRDNFYVVTASAPTPIGLQIHRRLLQQISNPEQIFGAYDPFRQEYRAVIRETGLVWRYSFIDKAWSTDEYPLVPKSLSIVKWDKSGLTIDELPGTIDSLVGTIDDLGLVARVRGAYINFDGTVNREDPTISDDTAGFIGTEIRTGMILPEAPLRKVQVVEVQLEYESSVSATLTVEYSTDGGTTWRLYSTCQVAPTTGPSVAACRRFIEANEVQLRIRTTRLPTVTLIALHAFTMPGAMVKP